MPEGLGADIAAKAVEIAQYYDKKIGRAGKYVTRGAEFCRAVSELYKSFGDQDMIRRLVEGSGSDSYEDRYFRTANLYRIGKACGDYELTQVFLDVIEKYSMESMQIMQMHLLAEAMHAKTEKGKEHAMMFCNVMKSEDISKVMNRLASALNRYDSLWTRQIFYDALNIASNGHSTETIIAAVNFMAAGASKAHESENAPFFTYDISAVKERGKLLETASWAVDDEGMQRLIRLLSSMDNGLVSEFASHFDFSKASRSNMSRLISGGFDRMITDQKSLTAVMNYLTSPVKIPPPTAETVEKYDYMGAVFGALAAQGILLNSSQASVLMDSKVGAGIDLIKMIRDGAERDVRYYSLYSGEDISSLNLSRADMERYALSALYRSKTRERDAQAVDILCSIVGAGTVARARSDIQEARPELIGPMSSILRDISIGESEKVSRCLGLLMKTGSEAVAAVAGAANYMGVPAGMAQVRAAESKNPLDYDGRIQYACVYFPEAAQNGILEYCRDRNIVLVKYGTAEVARASAICYMERDIFLVDSVEGDNSMKKNAVFNIIYRDLEHRAASHGASMLLFNASGQFNIMPNKFNKYLSYSGLKRITVPMELKTSSYIEAKSPVEAFAVELRGRTIGSISRRRDL